MIDLELVLMKVAFLPEITPLLQTSAKISSWKRMSSYSTACTEQEKEREGSFKSSRLV
jgi:hypothetical protein